MHFPDSSPRASLYYNYQIFPFRRPPELNGESVQHKVVIVGAGPVGLVTALDLARYGIPSVLVEADVQVSQGSRAIVFTRRSMEILQQVGVADRMMEKALPWRCGNSIYRGERVFRMEAPYDEDDRYQPMNNLQQQYLEEYLVDQAEAEPLVDLRWGTKVTAITNRADGVALTVDTPEGEYQLHSDWLVASDGARSAVRGMMGLRMEGDSYTGSFVIADIKIDIDLPTERLAFFDPDWNPGNTILMHKEPEGIWRLDYQLPVGETPEEALQPESLHKRIQAQLDMIGVTAEWEMDWCSVYSARAMTLPDYVNDRVLFTGDAAHMLPIFGVRGANTGWQDCHNMAWKLAFKIKGWAPDHLLPSYSQERVVAAWEIIDEASKSTRFMTPPDRGFRLLRDATLSLSLTQPFVRPLFHWRTSRAHDYVESVLNCNRDDNARFTAGPANGSPLQNIKLGENDYLFDHLGASIYLFYFSDQAELPQSLLLLKEAVARSGVPFEIVQICRQALQVTGHMLIQDADGHMHERYGAEEGTTYLIRPDQHVAARWKQQDNGDVLTALKQLISLA
ncbi:FAD-dependent monooxygenase [Pontibacterium sp.]|uniref:FAD-dependent monooxygenase n=1 Tax=Pontibacterium sp. TaxID=2036026 RepID=UPI00351670FA